MPLEDPGGGLPTEGGGGPDYGGGLSNFFGGGGFGGIGGGGNFYAPPQRRLDQNFNMNRGGLIDEINGRGQSWGVGAGGSGFTNPGSGGTQPGSGPPGPGPGPGPQFGPPQGGMGQWGRFGRPAIGYPTTQPTGASFGRRREDYRMSQPFSAQPQGGAPFVGQNPWAGTIPGNPGGGGGGGPQAYQMPGNDAPIGGFQHNYHPDANWVPGEGDFRQMQHQILNAFHQAGYFDPGGNRMLIEAGRMNAANTSRAMQEQQRIAGLLHGTDPTQQASGMYEAGIRGQGGQAAAINDAVMRAYYQQADLAGQMAGQLGQSGARRERAQRQSPMGSIMGAIGTIGGAALGGPIGGALASRIGGLFGGGASYNGGAGGDNWTNDPGYQGYTDYRPSYGQRQYGQEFDQGGYDF